MAKRKRETVKVEATLLRETEKAWLFMIKDEECWVPKSVGQWELHDDAEEEGTLEVEAWFAEKENLSA